MYNPFLYYFLEQAGAQVNSLFLPHGSGIKNSCYIKQLLHKTQYFFLTTVGKYFFFSRYPFVTDGLFSNTFFECFFQGWALRSFLFCSERIVLLCSFIESNVLFRSFFEFLATYETQKNAAFFSVLFLRTEKNAKSATFFCKERKRTQRTFCSFAKNVKERKNVSFFAKEGRTLRSFFQ